MTILTLQHLLLTKITGITLLIITIVKNAHDKLVIFFLTKNIQYIEIIIWVADAYYF